MKKCVFSLIVFLCISNYAVIGGCPDNKLKTIQRQSYLTVPPDTEVYSLGDILNLPSLPDFIEDIQKLPEVEMGIIHDLGDQGIRDVLSKVHEPEFTENNKLPEIQTLHEDTRDLPEYRVTIRVNYPILSEHIDEIIKLLPQHTTPCPMMND